MAVVDYRRLMQPGTRGPELLTLADVIAAIDPAASWKADAACRDQPLRLFFPESGETAGPARALCESCPVQAECLDYAVELGWRTGGVWGGTTAQERKQLREQRGSEGAPAGSAEMDATTQS